MQVKSFSSIRNTCPSTRKTSPAGRKISPSTRKDGKGDECNPNKKKGAGRQTITLGGLHRVRKGKIRKEKQKLRRILGGMEILWSLRNEEAKWTTTRSVFFADNTAGGELARRLQEAEKEAEVVTGYRVRITESAGTPLT